MSDGDAVRSPPLARLHGARFAARLFGVLAAVALAYACWRGYQNPDFLLGIGQALGLC